MNIRSLSILSLLVMFFILPDKAHAQTILGFWLTQDRDGIIELYPCEDETVCGRFFWLKDDNAENPSLDDRNPDPELKKRPLCGMTFLGGFSKNTDGVYRGGWIYSIRHGAEFSANLTLLNENELQLRGYMFIPFLGGDQVWSRTEPSQSCYLINRGSNF